MAPSKDDLLRQPAQRVGDMDDLGSDFMLDEDDIEHGATEPDVDDWGNEDDDEDGDESNRPNPGFAITVVRSTFEGKECVDVFAEGVVDEHARNDHDLELNGLWKAQIARVGPGSGLAFCCDKMDLDLKAKRKT